MTYTVVLKPNPAPLPPIFSDAYSLSQPLCTADQELAPLANMRSERCDIYFYIGLIFEGSRYLHFFAWCRQGFLRMRSLTSPGVPVEVCNVFAYGTDDASVFLERE